MRRPLAWQGPRTPGATGSVEIVDLAQSREGHSAHHCSVHHTHPSSKQQPWQHFPCHSGSRDRLDGCLQDRNTVKPQGPRKGSSDCNAPTPPRLQGGSSSRGRGSKPRWLQADTRSMRDISMSLFCSVEKCRSACNRAVIHCCLHSRSTSAFVRPAPRRRGGGLGGGGTCGVPCEGVGCDEGGCESGCGKGADRS